MNKLTLGITCSALLLSSLSPAQAVIIGNKDWRQLTDTTGISYTQMDQIYDINTGSLSDLNNTTLVNATGATIDFAEYKWASVDEVRELFNTYLSPGSALTPTNPGITAFESVFAPLVFNDFTPTDPSVIGRFAEGFTRSMASSTSAFTGTVFDSHFSFIADSIHAGGVGFSLPIDRQFADRGQWMYTTVVPVPAAVWFMGSGLLGLMGFSRKNKVQSVAA